jgi:hypothetical protein
VFAPGDIVIKSVRLENPGCPDMNAEIKKYLPFVLILGLLLVISGCAASPSGLVDTATAGGKIAGFWHGVWHGIIAPITFVISLFSDKVAIYEVHNTGHWYDFGFVLGIILTHGSGAASSRRIGR